MTYTPDHMLVHLTYRQQQLRQEAEAYRRGRNVRDVPRRRARSAASRAATAVTTRIRRSAYSLTEWPHPV